MPARLTETLAKWCATNLGGEPHDFDLRPLAGAGHSNEMWEIVRGEQRWIMRSPPPAKNDPSAHDVLREHGVLLALDQTDVPHPRPVAACADPGVIGVPFYVMEYLDGFALVDPLPEPYASDPAQRHGLGPAQASALARLGDVRWREIGLDGFGRPAGFLERQVPRWLRQFEGYKVRELPGLYDVAAWLDAARPAEYRVAILHGDYHARNVMFALGAGARLQAIVDWEMTTIGDPLLDLGLLLSTWSHADERPLISGALTQLPGMARRAELVAAYRDAGGSVSDESIGYYMALALFKLGCILEGSYGRHLAGTSTVAGHAGYETLVPAIFERAHDITRGRWGVSI